MIYLLGCCARGQAASSLGASGKRGLLLTQLISMRFTISPMDFYTPRVYRSWSYCPPPGISFLRMDGSVCQMALYVALEHLKISALKYYDFGWISLQGNRWFFLLLSGKCIMLIIS